MEVSFQKKKNGCTVMTIIRSDGTTTWSALRRGMEIHDLAHLAVESTLYCKDAFFAMVDRGVDISDFEGKRTQPHISVEAKQVEHLVLLLQLEHQQRQYQNDFMDQYQGILKDHDLPKLEELNDRALKEIRLYLDSLVKNVSTLKTDEVYHVEFSLNE